MVKQNSKDKYFYCEECEMEYKDKSKAIECEEWCRKYKSCNLEIIKYSVNMKGGKRK